jgi:predicted O-methyltransferase YrrM
VPAVADSRSATETNGFEEAWAKASVIEGWLSREQGSVLHAAAGCVQPGCWIVEVGTWHGKSTVLLAHGKTPQTVLLTIDPYPERPYGGGEEAYRTLLANVRRSGAEDDVQLFRGTSEEGARAFDLISELLDDPYPRTNPLADASGSACCSWTGRMTATRFSPTSTVGSNSSSTGGSSVFMTRFSASG